MVSFLRQPRSLKQRRLNAKRWPGSFSGPVTGDGFIGGRVLQSGCLDNQRLSQALALQKRKKKTSQGLHYNNIWFLLIVIYFYIFEADTNRNNFVYSKCYRGFFHDFSLTLFVHTLIDGHVDFFLIYCFYKQCCCELLVHVIICI